MAGHRAPGWWRAARGRAGQPEGRHTPHYLEAVEPGLGMYPMGAAGRESLDQHHQAEPERGDRHSNAARRTAAANTHTVGDLR
jgi:hypothetical protein